MTFAANSKSHARWYHLGVWLLLALGLTPLFWFTELDIRAARLFYDTTHPEAPWWLDNVLWVKIFYYAPPVLVALMLIAAIWAFVQGARQPQKRRMQRNGVFLLVTLLLGPGILVNAVFKNHWGRPRPKHIVQFNGPETYRPPLLKGEAGKAKSFPAGHPSVAFAYVAFYFLFRRSRPKLAWTAFILSTLLGVGMGAARMAAGAHFLSDVIWSALITWWAVWFAYYFIVRMETEPETTPETCETAAVPATNYSGVATCLAWFKNSALVIGVLIMVVGVLLATPLHKQFKFEWGKLELAPSALMIVSPGASVRVRVIADGEGPAFSIKQTIQGFGLPGGWLKASTDPIKNPGSWTYEGRARGTFTDLENTVEIVVRSTQIATMQVFVGEGGGVEVEDDSGRLAVTSDVRVEAMKREPSALPNG